MPRISSKQARARLKTGLDEPAIEAPPATPCPLCGRPLVPGPSVDEHHLVPRSRRGRDKFPVHRICHTKIHATLTEKQLAKDHHTWEALRAHPEIAAFIAWLQKKPAEFIDRNTKSRALRRR
jgi:hypothetical protein